MTSPAESLEILARFWESYAEGLEAIRPPACREDLGALLEWSGNRQQSMDELDRIMEKIRNCAETLSLPVEGNSAGNAWLEVEHPDLAARIETASRRSREQIERLLAENSELNEILQGQVKDTAGRMQELQEGQKAVRAYHPTNSGESRFFDQKN